MHRPHFSIPTAMICVAAVALIFGGAILAIRTAYYSHRAALAEAASRGLMDQAHSLRQLAERKRSHGSDRDHAFRDANDMNGKDAFKRHRRRSIVARHVARGRSFHPMRPCRGDPSGQTRDLADDFSRLGRPSRSRRGAGTPAFPIIAPFTAAKWSRIMFRSLPSSGFGVPLTDGP